MCEGCQSLYVARLTLGLSASMTQKKQLVLVVEGTIDLGSHWQTILSNYLDKVIRKFCVTEATEASSSVVELALVQFNAHGSYSSCLVQRSCWTRNVDHFLEWLSHMHFTGGGFCDAAIAEGLAEVLMMCPPSHLTETQPTEVVQRHCILVAASNPCLLPTVYWPKNKSESHLSDAETVAKSFPQSCVSLSVICPKQLPKLKAIYNAGKRNPSATAPVIDVVKNPNYLILISEDFMEACVALSPSVRSSSPENESLPTVPLANVKVEPNTVSLQVAQHAGTMTTAPQRMQSVGVNNNMGTYVGVSQQTPSAPQSRQPKYVKIWEGNLHGKRQGHTLFITRLEAFSCLPSAADTLANDWPSTLIIDKVISQDHMYDKPHFGESGYIVCRVFTVHGFVGQMQDKKLCGVIRLPSQTLLLSPFKNSSRLVGKLLPKDVGL